MSQYRIAVFVGSLRKESFNRRLALALEKLAGDRARFDYVEIGNLPLYDQDQDHDYPEQGKRLKTQVNDADAVLFVTPEYNRSIPGVLKNAIDLGSRPYGENAFSGKPAAVCGVSPGTLGTALAQQHLRNVLAYLDMPVLGQPEVFVQFQEGLIEADGSIGNEDTRKFLQGFVDKFIAWIDELQA